MVPVVSEFLSYDPSIQHVVSWPGTLVVIYIFFRSWVRGDTHITAQWVLYLNTDWLDTISQYIYENLLGCSSQVWLVLNMRTRNLMMSLHVICSLCHILNLFITKEFILLSDMNVETERYLVIWLEIATIKSGLAWGDSIKNLFTGNKI